MVKGHINTSEETILSSYDGYFKRLWNNSERAEYGMEGFEEAFDQRESKKKTLKENQRLFNLAIKHDLL